MAKVISFSDDFWNWIIRILIPCLFALTISITIQIKNKTASISNSIMSIVIGVSIAYLTGDFILKHFSSDFATIIIGLVTIGGEKVGYWIVYKFKFDAIGEACIKWIIRKLTKKITLNNARKRIRMSYYNTSGKK